MGTSGVCLLIVFSGSDTCLANGGSVTCFPIPCQFVDVLTSWDRLIHFVRPNPLCYGHLFLPVLFLLYVLICSYSPNIYIFLLSFRFFLSSSFVVITWPKTVIVFLFLFHVHIKHTRS